MGKTAIILGATGLTGNLLLNRLLADDVYESVKVFSRRAIGLNHPKLTEYLGDLLKLDEFKADFTGDEVFCCIGTMANKSKDKALYRKIDFGIPLAAARLCKKNRIESFLVISALGANAESKLFYNRTKGKMERAVLTQRIKNTYILRPSLIKGKRGEKRLGESIGAFLIKITEFILVGGLKKYRAIEAKCIAATMHRLAKSKPDYHIIESDKIQELGETL